MDIAVNEDWASARRRLEAFWEREIIDRPCLQVYVPSRPETLEIDVEAERYWTDPETFFRIERQRYLGSGYLGEAFPALNNKLWMIPAMVGAHLECGSDTIWSQPCAQTLEEIDFSVFSQSHPICREMAALVRSCVEHGAGECFVGFPQMPNAGDTLAIIRGWSNYCLDIADNIGRVLILEEQMTQIWMALYDLFSEIINEYMEGSCGWLPAWHPRRSALIEFDLGGMISPRQFECFLPYLVERACHAERAIYHLDGKGALVHLDTILSLPEIDAVQWVPGTGSGDLLSWVPVMQRIQQVGKGLYVDSRCEPDEAILLLNELRPEGVIIPVAVSSEDEGRRLLEHVQKLC